MKYRLIIGWLSQPNVRLGEQVVPSYNQTSVDALEAESDEAAIQRARQRKVDVVQAHQRFHGYASSVVKLERIVQKEITEDIALT